MKKRDSLRVKRTFKQRVIMKERDSLIVKGICSFCTKSNERWSQTKAEEEFGDKRKLNEMSLVTMATIFITTQTMIME